ncbi:MAG: TonB-dependent receptor [Dysgonomonas sp.]
MKKKVVLTVLICCLANIVCAQITLKGKIVDESERPISNASVRLEKTTIGTVSDAAGNFELKNVPDGNYVLRATCIDFEAARLNVDKSQDNIVLTLVQSYLNLNEVVVTGTGTHRRLKDSPIAVEVISQKELKSVNIPSFENAMIALNPSLTFTPNAMGSYMQMNGLSNKYILVLVDGKKLHGDVAGNIDLSRINMNNVKRIEILKGAASSLYGSEAIGGVINIITDKHKEKIFASSNTRYSEYGQFTQGLNLEVNAGIFSSSTSYQRNQSDGWQISPNAIDSKTGDTIPTTAQASMAFYSDVLSQRFSVAASKQLSLYVEGGLYDKKLQRPATAYDYNLLYKDYTIAAGGKYLLRGNGFISLDMNTDNYNSSYVYIKDLPKKNITNGDDVFVRRQKYYNANLKGVFDLGRFNKVSVGTDYRVDYLEHATDVKDGSKDVYTAALYAQDEIRLLDGKLQLVPGIRYVYHETFKSKLTPKLAAMYSLEHFNFRASYSAGFKTPELKELYYEAIKTNSITEGNLDLKPETSDYYTIGTEYTSGNFTASINGYINNLKNQIDKVTVENKPEDPVGMDRNQYQNIGKSRIKGFDIAFNYYIGAGFSAGGGYAYVRAKNLDTDTDLERISRHTGNVNASWAKETEKSRYSVNLNGRLQSKRYFSNEWARTYQLWNLSAYHTIKNVNGISIEPGMGIENIFNFVDDRPFGSSYATLTPGRTIFISLGLKFSK